jgi:hypothetical protein
MTVPSGEVSQGNILYHRSTLTGNFRSAVNMSQKRGVTHPCCSWIVKKNGMGSKGLAGRYHPAEAVVGVWARWYNLTTPVPR